MLRPLIYVAPLPPQVVIIPFPLAMSGTVYFLVRVLAFYLFFPNLKTVLVRLNFWFTGHLYLFFCKSLISFAHF